MTVYLYKICFTETSKVYIGQTNNPKARWRLHKADALKGSKYKIHRAMRKYGLENAKFEVISSVIGNPDDAEMQLITQYDSYKNGYNMTKGGMGCRGYKHSQQQIAAHKAKMSGSWRLYFLDGRQIEIKNLKEWCKNNGYHRAGILRVYRNEGLCHKDVIMAEKVS